MTRKRKCKRGEHGSKATSGLRYMTSVRPLGRKIRIISLFCLFSVLAGSSIVFVMISKLFILPDIE